MKCVQCSQIKGSNGENEGSEESAVYAYLLWKCGALEKKDKGFLISRFFLLLDPNLCGDYSRTSAAGTWKEHSRIVPALRSDGDKCVLFLHFCISVLTTNRYWSLYPKCLWFTFKLLLSSSPAIKFRWRQRHVTRGGQIQVACIDVTLLSGCSNKWTEEPCLVGSEWSRLFG